MENNGKNWDKMEKIMNRHFKVIGSLVAGILGSQFNCEHNPVTTFNQLVKSSELSIWDELKVSNIPVKGSWMTLASLQLLPPDCVQKNATKIGRSVSCYFADTFHVGILAIDNCESCGYTEDELWECLNELFKFEGKLLLMRVGFILSSSGSFASADFRVGYEMLVNIVSKYFGKSILQMPIRIKGSDLALSALPFLKDEILEYTDSYDLFVDAFSEYCLEVLANVLP